MPWAPFQCCCEPVVEPPPPLFCVASFWGYSRRFGSDPEIRVLQQQCCYSNTATGVASMGLSEDFTDRGWFRHRTGISAGTIAKARLEQRTNDGGGVPFDVVAGMTGFTTPSSIFTRYARTFESVGRVAFTSRVRREIDGVVDYDETFNYEARVRFWVGRHGEVWPELFDFAGEVEREVVPGVASGGADGVITIYAWASAGSVPASHRFDGQSYQPPRAQIHFYNQNDLFECDHIRLATAIEWSDIDSSSYIDSGLNTNRRSSDWELQISNNPCCKAPDASGGAVPNACIEVATTKNANGFCCPISIFDALNATLFGLLLNTGCLNITGDEDGHYNDWLIDPNGVRRRLSKVEAPEGVDARWERVVLNSVEWEDYAETTGDCTTSLGTRNGSLVYRYSLVGSSLTLEVFTDVPVGGEETDAFKDLLFKRSVEVEADCVSFGGVVDNAFSASDAGVSVETNRTPGEDEQDIDGETDFVMGYDGYVLLAIV